MDMELFKEEMLRLKVFGRITSPKFPVNKLEPKSKGYKNKSETIKISKKANNRVCQNLQQINKNSSKMRSQNR